MPRSLFLGAILLTSAQDTHVPRAGRDLIRATLEDANTTSSVPLFLAKCVWGGD